MRAYLDSVEGAVIAILTMVHAFLDGALNARVCAIGVTIHNTNSPVIRSIFTLGV